MIKFNLTKKICTIEDGEGDKFLLVFYPDKKDMGKHDKAIVAMEFDNWNELCISIGLIFNLIQTISKDFRDGENDS